MKEAELVTSKSKPSQIPMGFPHYRRSHLCCQTCHTLIHFLSHLSASSTPLHTPSHHLQIPDNGSGRMGQEKQEKEPECSEFVGTGFMNPNHPVPQKEIQEVHEIVEGFGDQGRDFSSNKMVPDDTELMMGMEEMSMQANGCNKEQRLMDELELVVKETEDFVCDSGVIPLNLGLDGKRNGSREIELMDYKVEHVEFQNPDVNKSGNTSNLQVQGEINQLASEGFHPALMVNVSTSTKEQSSASVISTLGIRHERQQKGMQLVKSFCAAMGSLPTTEEGEFEKEEQCGRKVAEAIHLSLDQDMNSEALNVSEDGRLYDSAILEYRYEMWNEEDKLEKLICANTATNSSNNLIETGDVEEGEISGDFGMDGNSCDMSSADALILQQKIVDQVQKPTNVIENIVFPYKIGNGEKEEGYESNSFMVNALQDANDSGQVKPRTSDKKGIACEVEVASSQDNIGSKGVTDLPTDLAQNQVLHIGLLEEDTAKNHGNSSAVKWTVDVSSKKKAWSWF